MKAIYGLAMPFMDSYIEYDEGTNTFKVDKTNKESVELDSLIGATLGHDYTKELGRTSSNLTIKVNDQGLFFKLVPDSPLGLSTYKKVKNGALRHCSISYAIRDRRKDIEGEKRMRGLSQLFDSDIVVKEYKSILVFEVSIGNHPANPATFCTTDQYDSRLRGVRFDDE